MTLITLILVTGSWSIAPPKKEVQKPIIKEAVYYKNFQEKCKWTWKGNLRTHLHLVHKIEKKYCDTTEALKLIAIHDSLHSKTRLESTGILKTKNYCPT